MILKVNHLLRPSLEDNYCDSFIHSPNFIVVNCLNILKWLQSVPSTFQLKILNSTYDYKHVLKDYIWTSSPSLYNSHMIFYIDLRISLSVLQFSLPETSQIYYRIRTLFFKTQLQSSHHRSLSLLFIYPGFSSLW